CAVSLFPTSVLSKLATRQFPPEQALAPPLYTDSRSGRGALAFKTGHLIQPSGSEPRGGVEPTHTIKTFRTAERRTAVRWLPVPPFIKRGRQHLQRQRTPVQPAADPIRFHSTPFTQRRQRKGKQTGSAVFFRLGILFFSTSGGLDLSFP